MGPRPLNLSILVLLIDHFDFPRSTRQPSHPKKQTAAVFFYEQMPMPDSQSTHPIRVLIASPWKLDVWQLSQDLAGESSVRTSTSTTAGEMENQIRNHRPDVMLLDIDLEADQTPKRIINLLQTQLIPTVVRADTRQTPAGLLLDCLDAGALAIVNRSGSVDLAEASSQSLSTCLRAAASASVSNLRATTAQDWRAVSAASTDAILAIGGGMGSYNALCGILSQLPAGGPCTVVIAPLQSALISTFAARLATRCSMQVQVAENGQPIRPGQILIAPGHAHLLARQTQNGCTVAIKPGPAIFDQKPSIEMLFGSLADIAGSQTIGVLLGGSGIGGVASLLALRNSGGSSIVQSPDTCVLAEATTRATRCNAAEANEPAENIAMRVMEFASRRSSLRAA